MPVALTPISIGSTNWGETVNSYWETITNAFNGTETIGPLHIAPSTALGLQLDPFGAGAGETSELRLLELAANGTHYVGFKAPDAIGANRIWTLPSADGSNGQVLATNGSGTLSWQDGGSGSVTDVTATSPLASSGGTTPNISISNQSANVVLAGPASGGAAAPAFRALVTDDLASQIVTYAKIQNVSATDKILGRSSAGAGVIEEITCTSAGRALLDDADASAQRATLGLVIGTDVQAYDAALASIAGLTTSADKMIYTTASDTYAVTSLTSFARTVLDDTDASAARATLGLVIGTDVQAYDAALASIAGLTTSADKMIYTTASDTYAVTSLTSFARTLLDDTDATAARATLGVVIGTDVQAYDAALASIAGLTTSADKMIYTTASDTYAVTALTAFARTLLDDTDATEAQSTLGLVIGTNVQAFDAGLASIAGLTTSADKMIYTTASDTYTVTALTIFARSLLDDTDASEAQATLGLVIGTNVQAFDAALTSIAGLTTAADKMIYTTASDTYTTTTLTTYARTLLDDVTALDARATLELTIGVDVQAYDADLAAIAGLSSTGLIARTGAGTASVRSITGAAADGISVTNGDGVSGNPAIALNINGMTALTTPADADEIAIYDASVPALRKITRTNFLSGVGTNSFVVRPFSEIPLTAGKVFANVHVGSGGNAVPQEEGLGVMASLNGNATWSLRFQMPETLPSGTPKLKLIALAAANSGTAQVQVKWAPVAMGEDPSSASLNPGDTVSPAWSSGDSNKYKEVGPVSLTYYTIEGGDIVIVALNFLTSSWSLAAVSTWQASIIWE